MTQIHSVKLNKLALSDINVRKAGDDLIDQFAADIAARGILQNLIVTPVKKPRGSFAVIAGSRRLRALTLLAERGEINAAEYDVPVMVLEADPAMLSETSLAENFQRLAMSPADECRAFQHFIGQDGDIDAVSKRFGISRRFIEGRLRLASLADPIFEALATGKITLDIAKAYASTVSHERQLMVWGSYGANGYYNADAIRRVIANETMKSNEPVALLVGADAYVAAGGVIDRDLFSDSGDRWTNPEIAERLAGEKLEAEAARLGAELGLAWIRPIASTNTWELARSLHRVRLPEQPMTEAEEARVSELTEKLEALEHRMEVEDLEEADYQALSDEHDGLTEERLQLISRPKIVPDELKPRVGTFLTLTQRGEMVLDDDFYSETPIRVTAIVEDEALETNGSDGDTSQPDFDQDEGGEDRPIKGWHIEEGPQPGTTGTAGSVEATAATPSGKQMSQVLFDQLAMQRRDVLGAALLGNPALALDYMLFSMIEGRGYTYGAAKSGTTIRASTPEDPVPASTLPTSLARAFIDEFHEGLDASWSEAESKVTRFEAFRQLDDDAKAHWMAWIVATSLEAKDEYGRPKQNALQNRLATILEIDVATWWRPTSENYFDRVSKGDLLTLLDEVGGPALSVRHASQKKTEISASSEKLFAGEAIVEAEVKQAALAWVPEAMRFNDTHVDAADALTLSGDDEHGGQEEPEEFELGEGEQGGQDGEATEGEALIDGIDEGGTDFNVNDQIDAIAAE